MRIRLPICQEDMSILSEDWENLGVRGVMVLPKRKEVMLGDVRICERVLVRLLRGGVVGKSHITI